MIREKPPMASAASQCDSQLVKDRAPLDDSAAKVNVNNMLGFVNSNSHFESDEIDNGTSRILTGMRTYIPRLSLAPAAAFVV